MMRSAQKTHQNLLSTATCALHRAPAHPVKRILRTQKTLLHDSALSRSPSRPSLRTPLRYIFNGRFHSTKPSIDPTPNLRSPQPSLSLSQRMRKLSREYGWSALGVYLMLTAIDFPFCFLAVRWLGTERIGHLEHFVITWFWKIVPYPFPSQQEAEIESAGKDIEVVGTRARGATEVEPTINDHGIAEAEQLNQSENASKYSFPRLSHWRKRWADAGVKVFGPN